MGAVVTSLGVETYSELADHELVRVRRSIVVTMTGPTQGAVDAALRECRRHVRPYAFFGVFVEAVQFARRVLAPDARGYQFVAAVNGETWRTAGTDSPEYTVHALRWALSSAYGAAGGTGALRVAVLEMAGPVTQLRELQDLVDFRIADRGEAPLAAGVARVGNIASSAGDAVVSLGEGTSEAAQGIGDFAAGLGEGTRAVGAVARSFPLLTFGLTAAVAAFVGVVLLKR